MEERTRHWVAALEAAIEEQVAACCLDDPDASRVTDARDAPSAASLERVRTMLDLDVLLLLEAGDQLCEPNRHRLPALAHRLVGLRSRLSIGIQDHQRVEAALREGCRLRDRLAAACAGQRGVDVLPELEPDLALDERSPESVRCDAKGLCEDLVGHAGRRDKKRSIEDRAVQHRVRQIGAR
jgi:hypothetical protein